MHGERDFLVRKRGAGGAPQWSTQLGGAGNDVTWALAADVNDAVWVGHEEDASDFSHGTLVITKLAP